MSNIISIKAQERCDLGTANARRIRREGMVPVVVYSHGQEAKSFTISAADAALVQYHSGLLELVNEASDAKRTAVVKEVQVHPLNMHIMHIDFQAVKADEVIESIIPLEGVGEPAGIRAGGQLEQVLFELTIKSKPAEIPEKITVDISGIELDQALHVSDIVAPEGVEIVTDAELVAFHVRTAKVEEEPEEAADAAAEPAEEEKK